MIRKLILSITLGMCISVFFIESETKYEYYNPYAHKKSLETKEFFKKNGKEDESGYRIYNNNTVEIKDYSNAKIVFLFVFGVSMFLFNIRKDK